MEAEWRWRRDEVLKGFETRFLREIEKSLKNHIRHRPRLETTAHISNPDIGSTLLAPAFSTPPAETRHKLLHSPACIAAP
jgi:hypothetical protein